MYQPFYNPDIFAFLILAYSATQFL